MHRELRILEFKIWYLSRGFVDQSRPNLLNMRFVAEKEWDMRQFLYFRVREFDVFPSIFIQHFHRFSRFAYLSWAFLEKVWDAIRFNLLCS